MTEISPGSVPDFDTEAGEIPVAVMASGRRGGGASAGAYGPSTGRGRRATEIGPGSAPEAGTDSGEIPVGGGGWGRKVDAM